MTDIGRLITAMVTPFDNDKELDYRQARNLAISLIESGSEGLVISGTTGESPTLTKEEKLKLFKDIKSEIGTVGSVIAGTGNYSTAESIEMTKEAEKCGVDAALLVVPYYNKPTQEGLYQHFKAIADNTSLPCILYNVPGRTSSNMSSETTARLSQVDNIIGIKEASGDFDQIARILANSGKNFRVWSGNDNDTLGIMTMGGYGIISVASHIVGLQIKNMINLILENKTKEAASEHLRLFNIFKDLFLIANPIPVKFALNHSGFRVGGTRLPLTDPDKETATKLVTMLENYKVDLQIKV
jgi:4-hydroxy-tetrahydrodipicolinate synthase